MKQRNAEHSVEQNNNNNSLKLENQSACDPSLLSGKGKATVHAEPSKRSCAKLNS
jgi:hypothetical protein